MIAVSRRIHGCVRRCGWMVLLLLLAGCSSSNGTITGKVTYQGKPLPSGTVTFVPEKGGSAVVGVIQDGEYKATKVPTGPAKIAVITSSTSAPPDYIAQMRPPAELMEKAGMDKSAAESAKSASPSQQAPSLPEKFKDPDKSGLTYTVKSGTQVHNIDLPAQ